jgi:hypothetical protein
MSFMSNFVGGEFKHASFANNTLAMGSPKTAATSQSDGIDAYERIPRKHLEQLYLIDPQTFNTINTYKQLLLQAGYKITAENKTNQKQYDDFFKNIGKIGMRMKLEQLTDRIIHDESLYGYAYVERVFDTSGKIVDLKPVDAKLMDYARDQNNMILVDETQNPVGYTMEVGYAVKAYTDSPPKGIKMNNTQIFLREERIACFILFPYGNGFESMGIVEPAFRAIDRKLKIETAVANTIHNTAAYPVYAIVGDQQRGASKQVMDNTLTALQNFSSNRFGVFPYPTTLNTLQVEHSPQAEEFLRYLRTEQSSASGLALGFSAGTGEAVNRSTLGTQKEMLDVRMDSLSYATAEQFTTKILDYLYEFNGYGSRAKMTWNDISTEDKEIKSKILFEGIVNKAIAPEEIRDYLLTSNDIVPNESAYNKMIKEDKENTKKQQTKDLNTSKKDKQKKSEEEDEDD